MDFEKNPGLLERIEEGRYNDIEADLEFKGSSFRSDICDIFLKYLDRCTLTGVPFIRSSENRYVKAVWSLLVFVAICVMTVHLVKLFASYYEYETHSQVVYQLSALSFPAITFCNVNPIRKSMKSVAWDQDSVFFHLFDDVELNYTDNMEELDISNKSSKSIPGLTESSSMFDDFFEHALQHIYQSENKTQSANATVQDMLHGKSAWYTIMKMFRDTFALVSDEKRSLIGHQLNDMVIECYYNGYNCNASCFKLSPSIIFGNCYTLQCNNFFSSDSGPEKGLTLILRLELAEYMSILSESKGALLVVHERDTLAFPGEDGIALAAGSENLIGIRQVDVSRLQYPYGKCTPVEIFQNLIGMNPTRNTCLKMCRQEYIINECGCYDNKLSQINYILKMSERMQFCRLPKELDCVLHIENNFSEYSNKCTCDNPCTEKRFEKAVSTRQWPSPDFTKLLVESVCLKTPESCKSLRNSTTADLKEEFLKVSIYFEDLNHEVYAETPDYELTQFLSDVGGTIGLWIGLSILGLFEILHLIIELVIYVWGSLCSLTRRKKEYHRF